MGSQLEFSNFMNKTFREISGKAQEKGRQYTGGIDSDAFYNFKRSASEWDTWVQYQILQFAQKHWTFLIRWAKTTDPYISRKKTLDKVKDSAKDIVVFMLLLLFWIETNMLGTTEEE